MKRMPLLILKFLLLFSFLSFEPVSHSVSREISSDMAIFRLDDRVIYLSEINSLLKNIPTYKCLFPQGLIFTSLNVSGVKVKNFSPFKNQFSHLVNQSLRLEKILLLEKLIAFNLSDGRVIPASVVKKMEQSFCLKGKAWQNWDVALRKLVRAEYGLRDRFRGASKKAMNDSLATFFQNARKSISLERLF